MRESARGTPEASHFISDGCTSLRSALGIGRLLLPMASPSGMAHSLDGPGGGGGPDGGNEIVWDDYDAGENRLDAAAFMNSMNVLRVSELNRMERQAGASPILKIKAASSLSKLPSWLSLRV
jgi:hypothetical protein